MRIVDASNDHLNAIKKLHVDSFSEIGQTDEKIEYYFTRPENSSKVALDDNKEVVGYYIAADFDRDSWLEWFGVGKAGAGIGVSLLKAYLEDKKSKNITHSHLYTRNRFKDAMVLYLKNGFEFKGMFIGKDGDLMLQMTCKL